MGSLFETEIPNTSNSIVMLNDWDLAREDGPSRKLSVKYNTGIYAVLGLGSAE